MNFVNSEGGRHALSNREMPLVDWIKRPTQDSNPHDCSETSEESFLKTLRFNSSSPSPVTEEILITSI